MIRTEEMFLSLAEYGKDYYCGNDPIPEFNSKLNEAQNMLFDLLSAQYDYNERTRILLRPFIKSPNSPLQSNSSGVITSLPSMFNRFLSCTYTYQGKRYQMYYAKDNEFIEADFIPQRKADISKGIAYVNYNNGVLRVIPRIELSIDLTYVAYPSEVKLVYDYNVSRNSFAQVNEAQTVNLEWNEDAYNLLLSALLLKYSLIDKDQFKTEIANYMLSGDLINRP